VNRRSLEALTGGVVFVAFIAAHLLFGISAAVKVLGLGCAISGIVWAFGRSIPVGIEDRKPSFFIRGVGAVVAGLAMVGLGIFLLLYSGHAACLLGWAQGVACE
jgi:hypothetical protein